MVAIPRLETYSNEQLSAADAFSPAFARYRRLLRDPKLPYLQHCRHQAWCEAVAATYFNTATTEEICFAWSVAADEILRQAWRDCGLDKSDSVLFSLGKLGARELNLSSDIDILIVGDPNQSLSIEKSLRLFQQTLQFNGEHGFCFRLDFDLRPGGKMGPLITSPAQFQDYYWSQGETWERLALVRLRAITGSDILKKQIEDLARRFSYRKFLDFTLLDDLKALRSKVHQSGFQRRPQELHLKLEVGMIRDIELFVHSLQVLNGGKITELQTSSTTEALSQLLRRGLLQSHDAKTLFDNYWFYRHTENLVQSVDDRQTHIYSAFLPKLPTLPTAEDLESRRSAVNAIVSSLLGQVNLNDVRLPANEKTQTEWLVGLGFGKESIEELWPQLAAATALSHKNDRDERARQEFLYAFISELSKHRDRELGLALLLDFVRATRAKASFFTMLLRSPRLIQDLARLFCLSPYLGLILASRPELLDHFILQLDEDWSADPETLLKQMAERKLLTEIWAANQFLSDLDLFGLYERITETADGICLQLLSQLKGEFSGSNIEIVCLGKWGGRELGLRSDLDFIFVTPSRPNENDFKVAKRFISRLTDPLKSGNLYEIDLRLRPSGQSGPLLVGLEQLHSYWTESAQPWERQAYLRARSLGQKIILKKNELIEKTLSREDLEELKRIRGKLLKTALESADIKYLPGGLIDIEFVAQTAILAKQLPNSPQSTVEMIRFLANHDDLWSSHQEELVTVYNQLRRLEQSLQLASAHKVSEIDQSHDAFVKAANLIQLSASEAWQMVLRQTSRSGKILNILDPTGYNSRS